MNRLESGAASCGLFLETQRATPTGESPTHAEGAAALAVNVHNARTPLDAARGHCPVHSMRLLYDIIIAPVIYGTRC